MSQAVLHELKVISASRSRYKPGWDKRAVDVRASLLPTEYTNKAKASDRRQNGTNEGEIGPVQQKLISLGDIRGLVFGNFGELSEDGHSLIAAMADSRARVACSARGNNSFIKDEDCHHSNIMSGIRRKISVAAVKAQAFSLLGRLQQLGPGMRSAAGRRREAAEAERQWILEERAHQISRRSGRNVFRTGFAKF